MRSCVEELDETTRLDDYPRKPVLQTTSQIPAKKRAYMLPAVALLSTG